MPAGSPVAIAIYIQGISEAWITSGTPLPPTELDREVDVLQAEAVRGHLLERKALRRELRQRQLAGLVAVAARALAW